MEEAPSRRNARMENSGVPRIRGNSEDTEQQIEGVARRYSLYPIASPRRSDILAAAVENETSP